jgi:hypothetical protein
MGCDSYLALADTPLKLSHIVVSNRIRLPNAAVIRAEGGTIAFAAPLLRLKHLGRRRMRIATIALATCMALASTFALAQGAAGGGGGGGAAGGTGPTPGSGTSGMNTTNPATNPTAAPMGGMNKGGGKSMHHKKHKKHKM